MANDLYKKFGIELSDEASDPHVKGLVWGATATGKTELVLRNFPHVMVADGEGNSDQVVRNPNIPPFLRIKTKDPRKVLEVLRACASGQIKFPDGSPVETFCIDSWSVFWGIQQEAFTRVAERRAAQYNKATEEANMTMSDWSKAKRPLREILNEFNNSSIPYLMLIAREKDLMEGQGDNMKKVGVQMDVVKNTGYDMNFILHLEGVPGKTWKYTVDKVQGNLGTIFPLGSTASKFPMDKLRDYVSSRPVGVKHEETENDIADSIAADEEDGRYQKNQAGLVQFAREKYNLTPADVGKALKAAGFTGFDASKWAEMKKAVSETATTPVAQTD